ncbi:MAG TPA: RsmE family RNA methyltransferase [Thermoanaerobaculia bacterium]|nr:RsmE family RNA methyltransferase [Thermoanaerobaculia bacterium]
MSLPRARLIVSPLPAAGEKARLSGEETAHARARRLRRGDPVTLLDGSGRVARAVLTRLDSGGAEVAVEEIIEARKEEFRIELLVAGLRAERLAWIAEKAAELGVAELRIVETARTQSFRGTSKVLERLARVGREAAKQSESDRWPRCSGPVSFAGVLAEENPHRLILDPSGAPFPSKLPPGPVRVLVGPEGGWTSEELASAASRGWTAASLPAGKLRAETAAIAAVVLARAALARGRRD